MEASRFAFLWWLLVGGFASIATISLYRVMQGSIKYQGMLSIDNSGAIEPERLQALAITILGAAYYAVLGGQAAVDGTFELPEISNWMLGSIGASQAGFVGGKFFRIRKKP
jgi:hypothetical protein